MGYDYYLTLVSYIHIVPDATSDNNIITIEHKRFSIEEYFYAMLYTRYEDEDLPIYEDGVYTPLLDDVYKDVIKNMSVELELLQEEKDRIAEASKGLNVIKIDHIYKFTFRNDDKVIMLNDN